MQKRSERRRKERKNGPAWAKGKERKERSVGRQKKGTTEGGKYGWGDGGRWGRTGGWKGGTTEFPPLKRQIIDF